jgi:hypothetical protein
VIAGLRALIAGVAAGSLAACQQPDPCGNGATCMNLVIDSLEVKRIDQLELDVVYGGHHGTTTLGTVGDAFGLPISIPLTLDLPASPLIDVRVIAAGKLGGTVLGLGGESATVQQGTQASALVLMEPFDPCVEGELYCGLNLNVLGADNEALYRCTGGVPIFSMRCSSGCNSSQGSHGQCVGGP